MGLVSVSLAFPGARLPAPLSETSSSVLGSTRLLIRALDLVSRKIVSHLWRVCPSAARRTCTACDLRLYVDIHVFFRRQPDPHALHVTCRFDAGPFFFFFEKILTMQTGLVSITQTSLERDFLLLL